MMMKVIMVAAPFQGVSALCQPCAGHFLCGTLSAEHPVMESWCHHFGGEIKTRRGAQACLGHTERKQQNWVSNPRTLAPRCWLQVPLMYDSHMWLSYLY